MRTGVVRDRDHRPSSVMEWSAVFKGSSGITVEVWQLQTVTSSKSLRRPGPIL
jgi:hypothetical protein